MAGRLRSFGRSEVVEKIDTALREIRHDEPEVRKVEPGLRAAKDLGVPVDLDGYERKPPPSALNVVKTGFGPGAVPGRKPVPPPKRTPAKSPLATASRPARKAAGAPGRAPAPAAVGTGPVAAAEPDVLAPPTPPSRTRPEDDPGFTGVTASVKAHRPGEEGAPAGRGEGQGGAGRGARPAGRRRRPGQGRQGRHDGRAAGRAFDKKAFIAAVKAAIEAKSPKTLKEADDYKESGKAGEVKGEVKGLVTQGKEGQAKDIKAATDAPPDQSKAVPKPVTPMAAGAARDRRRRSRPPARCPKPAPAEQLNLAAGKHEVNQEMADAEVTETQLAQSNEPRVRAGPGRQEGGRRARRHRARASSAQQETQVIAQGKAEAAAETAQGVAGMQGAKGAALAKLVADKGKTKSKDEAKRAEVTTKIQGDLRRHRGRREEDPRRHRPEGGEGVRGGRGRGARRRSRTTCGEDVGVQEGPLRRLARRRCAGRRTRCCGMPDKVNEFYEAGRELYLKQMDGVISRVADIVGGDLTAAKQRIADRQGPRSPTYVKSLPTDLQKVGSEASKEIGDQFEQLESDVDAKQEALVDTLATKYVEARKGLDERIEELQAENKGLVDKAIGAIKAIINTIRELAAMLKNVLSRVAGVVGDIIKNPIGFLGNLIAGVKGGILKFKDNILDHLRKGLMSWLFGALAEGGIELPEHVRHQGHHQAARLDLRADLGEHPQPDRQADRREGDGRGREGRRDLQDHRHRGRRRAVEDDRREARRHQGDDPRAGQGLRRHEDHHRRHHLADRAAQPGRGVHQGLQADLRRRDVLREQRQPDRQVRQHHPRLGGRHRPRQRRRRSGQDQRRARPDGADHHRVPGQRARPRRDRRRRSARSSRRCRSRSTKAVDFVIKTGLKVAGPIIRGMKGISDKVKAKIAAGKAYVKGKI